MFICQEFKLIKNNQKSLNKQEKKKIHNYFYGARVKIAMQNIKNYIVFLLLFSKALKNNR